MSESAYTKIKRRESAVVQQMKAECAAWRSHCEQLDLLDRVAFQDWLVATFTPKELAIFHEIDWYDKKGTKRDCLHKLYMEARYGPADD